MRRLLFAALLAATTVIAVVPAQGATVRVQRFSGFRDLTVAGTQTRYRLRLAYVVPATWPRRGTGSAVARRSARSARPLHRAHDRPAVTGPAESAAARVERVQPSSGGTVLDWGTRRKFAWSVLRARGSDTVTGLLERPAPSMKTQPAGARAWLEVRFTARADPSRSATPAVPAPSARSSATRWRPPRSAGSSSSPPGTRPPRSRSAGRAGSSAATCTSELVGGRSVTTNSSRTVRIVASADTSTTKNVSFTTSAPAGARRLERAPDVLHGQARLASQSPGGAAVPSAFIATCPDVHTTRPGRALTAWL